MPLSEELQDSFEIEAVWCSKQNAFPAYGRGRRGREGEDMRSRDIADVGVSRESGERASRPEQSVEKDVAGETREV